MVAADFEVDAPAVKAAWEGVVAAPDLPGAWLVLADLVEEWGGCGERFRLVAKCLRPWSGLASVWPLVRRDKWYARLLACSKETGFFTTRWFATKMTRAEAAACRRRKQAAERPRQLSLRPLLDTRLAGGYLAYRPEGVVVDTDPDGDWMNNAVRVTFRGEAEPSYFDLDAWCALWRRHPDALLQRPAGGPDDFRLHWVDEAGATVACLMPRTDMAHPTFVTVPFVGVRDTHWYQPLPGGGYAGRLYPSPV